MEKHSVFLFFSPNHTIWAEEVLKQNGTDVKLIPVPRHLSSDCGYCVMIRTVDIQDIKRQFETQGVEYDRIEALE